MPLSLAFTITFHCPILFLCQSLSFIFSFSLRLFLLYISFSQSLLYIFTNPLRSGRIWSIFKQGLIGLNLEFSFSWTSCLTKAEEPSLPYYLPNLFYTLSVYFPFSQSFSYIFFYQFLSVIFFLYFSVLSVSFSFSDYFLHLFFLSWCQSLSHLPCLIPTFLLPALLFHLIHLPHLYTSA